jgi:hypothetical protein
MSSPQSGGNYPWIVTSCKFLFFDITQQSGENFLSDDMETAPSLIPLLQGKAAKSALTSQTAKPAQTATISTQAAGGNFCLFFNVRIQIQPPGRKGSSPSSSK